MREKNPSMKIVPRLEVSNMSLETAQEFLKHDNITYFIKILMRRMRANRLDGVVLEMNFIWAQEKLYQAFCEMLKRIREEFDKEGKLLIMPIFPISKGVKTFIDSNNFKYLSKYVDYFNLMAYDYISHNQEKENSVDFKNFYLSPKSWIKDSVSKYLGENKDLGSKILLGIPFYGFSLGLSKEKKVEGEIVDSKKVLQYLQDTNKYSFNYIENECETQLISKKDDTRINYPTHRV